MIPRKADDEAGRSEVALHGAISASLHALAWPNIGMALFSILLNPANSLNAILLLIALSMILVIGWAVAGNLLGFLAHRIFWGRIQLPLIYPAIAMALICDISLWIWIRTILL